MRSTWGYVRLALAGAIALMVGVAVAPAAWAAGQASPVARAAAAPAARAAGQASPAALVNPIVGTSGAVDTFPGPDMPFGMIQWSPDTAPQRPAGGGYEYDSSRIRGFSLTHISGPGCGAYGDVPILPTVGALPDDASGATAPFSHDSETAQAGYYEVTTGTGADAVTTELTTAMRAGVARFTFPAGEQSNLLFKLAGTASQVDGTSAQVVGDDELTGSVTAGHFCGAGDQRDYTLHFDVKFDQPFTAHSTWGDGPDGVALTFDTTDRQTVTARLGISFTSAANAADNLGKEVADRDFAQVRRANQNAWDNVLGRIEIAGGTPDQRTQFYTALYHVLLHPNVFSDENGQYMGMDGKVHTVARGHEQYANYSGWDIYRSQVQLAALIAPHQTSDSITSMLNDYDQGGMLPKWAQANGESYVMVGDPADPIIADAYAFGARDFDAAKALRAMVAEATKPSNIRPGQATLDQYGYLPYDVSYGCCNFYGPVSTQLEYDSADYAIASLAQSLGEFGTYRRFATRAQNWQNTFNPETGYVQARQADGAWVPGFTPGTGTGMVEGTSAQYTPMVPFNLAGLIAARGGANAWESYLDSLFTSIDHPSPTNADLSNEPSVEIPWEYDYVGAPWKTQQVVREAQQQLYFNAPVGQFGNDDLGAMSSWYVWSNLGLYPETPGTDTLVIGSPVFRSAVVHLANRRDITIKAPQAAPDAPYVQRLKVNGRTWNKAYLAGRDYRRGAKLKFDLGTRPNKAWGARPNAAPPSDTTGQAPAIATLSGGQVTVAPGGSARVTLTARNVTGDRLTLSADAKPPKGLTVAPDPARLRLAPGALGTLTLNVHASADAEQTFYSVPIALDSDRGDLPDQRLTVLVAAPDSLLRFMDNRGISSDDDPSAAQFDHSGYSYSEQALAAAGLTAGATATIDGTQFQWPNSPPGYPDNVVAAGQTIPVDPVAGAARIAFLGSATNGPSQGPVTLTYADGTTTRFELGLSDWTLGANRAQPSFGNVVAATTAYRNCACGADSVKTYIFEAVLPVDASKTLQSVTLPSGADRGDLHVFAIGTSATAPAAPTVDSLDPWTAAAGQQVTIHGRGFGTSPGYVAFSNGGVNWGRPGNSAAFHVDSWSDTAITFTVPTPSGPNGVWHVSPGTPASVSVTTAGGATSDAAVLEITPTDNPADYYDNASTSPDDNQTCADADGGGYTYSAQALAAAGLTPGATVTSGGLTYTWPSVQPCSPDNILAAGQELLVHAPAGATKLGLLGMSTDGSSSGTLIVHYTDGSTSRQTVMLNDWASGPGNGDDAVATMPYRNTGGGTSQTITMYVFATTVALDPAKTVASVTLPDVSSRVGTTAMHIYALAAG
jgi:predicted alpha-1,2-mannosidase